MWIPGYRVWVMVLPGSCVEMANEPSWIQQGRAFDGFFLRDLSYHNKGTLLFTINPYSGNLELHALTRTQVGQGKPKSSGSNVEAPLELRHTYRRTTFNTLLRSPL